MTTKIEIIAELKLANPIIYVGDNEQGYTELNAKEYEAQISQWADNRLEYEAKLLEESKPLTLTEKLDSVGVTIAELKKALGL